MDSSATRRLKSDRKEQPYTQTFLKSWIDVHGLEFTALRLTCHVYLEGEVAFGLLFESFIQAWWCVLPSEKSANHVERRKGLCVSLTAVLFSPVGGEV